MSETENIVKAKCYHCGDTCDMTAVIFEEKPFCCEGCKLVYSILRENQLCAYYSISETPGVTQRSRLKSTKKWGYLEDIGMVSRLVDFRDDTHTKVTFFIPSIHCSSCIWLLENLHKLHQGIVHALVNLPERKVSISFLNTHISLREVVELLTSIGYEPLIRLDSLHKAEKHRLSRLLYNKVGIAGFVFGNIMLLSFPEYLSIDASSAALKELFGYLIVLLSLPVFFYCSAEYFQSAYKGLRAKLINIDVPLSIGIIVFYIRSLYEIFSGTGPGYMDSFAGLIFFLLLGKLFQNKTFDLLNFERDYKSYFPIAVTLLKNSVEHSVPLSNISIGDRLVIRNNELIPVDSVLVSGYGHIDYSFLTGEANAVDKEIGEVLHAGGKQMGNRIEITVSKNVEQSYLTQLWNENALNKNLRRTLYSFSAVVSKYFTYALLAIAAGTFLFWLPRDTALAVSTVSAVLIIACPCALALSTPFALGNALRYLARAGFYLKNITVLEKLTKITSVVFDKTGTITKQEGTSITFLGTALTLHEMKTIFSTVRHSTHPVSRRIAEYTEVPAPIEPETFLEKEGEGIEAFIDDNHVFIGSGKGAELFLKTEETPEVVHELISGAHVVINGRYRGAFRIESVYRDKIAAVISNLQKKHPVSILSGDTPKEQDNLRNLIGEDVPMSFNQSPYDKLQYIQNLQRKGAVVLMIGDGLNDSGALQQSEVGISVSEDVVSFSPASDAILNGASMNKLHTFMEYANNAVFAVRVSFIVSLFYNIFGIVYAVTGNVTPLFAAILMPVSSVTVIALTVLLTMFYAKRRGIAG